jgi:hypothetical protein
VELDRLSDCELEEFIRGSLRAIRQAAHAGLDREVAIRRATDLEALVVAGRISPAEFELDDESRDVIYALVYHVLAGPTKTPVEAEGRTAAVYEFIRRLPWDDELAEEKEELLKDCTEAGWRQPGGTPAAAADSGRVVASPEGEASRIFASTIPVLQVIFSEVHELSEDEVQRLEGELRDWFLRFCRRSTSLPHNARGLLLAAGANFAEQSRRLGEETLEPQGPFAARLSRLLSRVLSEAARERPPVDN